MPKVKKKETPSLAKALKKEAKPSYYQAIGRRKESTARVKFFVGGKGEIIVNEKPVEKYFSGNLAKISYLQPLKLTDNLERFKITVKVSGGGLYGQLDAMVHGIARALDKIDREKYHSILKKAGLLTRDPRAKERRKAGFAHKARARKQSPKR